MAEETTTEQNINCDRATRVLNTAIIATKIQRNTNITARFQELMRKPGMSIILSAIQFHAKEYGVTEQVAAQAVIQTFRELDAVWDDYIFQEGLDRLKSQITSSV